MRISFYSLYLAFSSCWILPNAMAEGTLPKEYQGVYRGMSPTDESAVGRGELEITILEDRIIWRMATGLKVLTEETTADGWTAMTEAELAKEFRPGSGYAKKTTGFQRDGMRLLFISNPKTSRLLPARSDFGLLLRGGMGDMLAPTTLFSPSQLKKVGCERLLRSVEFWLFGSWKGGMIPRLKSNGRVP